MALNSASLSKERFSRSLSRSLSFIASSGLPNAKVAEYDGESRGSVRAFAETRIGSCSKYTYRRHKVNTRQVCDHVCTYIDKDTKVSEVGTLRHKKFEKSVLALRQAPFRDGLILYRGVTTRSKWGRGIFTIGDCVVALYVKQLSSCTAEGGTTLMSAECRGRTHGDGGAHDTGRQ